MEKEQLLELIRVILFNFFNIGLGVGYQPWLKEDPDSTLISFSTNDSNSYAHYVEAIDKYLEKYSNINNTRICSDKQTNSQIVTDGKAIDKEVNIFIIFF